MNDEYYNDWYADHENNLKEDFLMSFTPEQLRDSIIAQSNNLECDFFEEREEDWTKFKEEQFKIFMEERKHDRY